ncbi:hypothetical protein PRZ48_009291 [Zasmidium cellare]|uniref:Uncharacterized protein n=1 Tax=Zasmidium cellare TaxID=395010 RepID=A0ABR0EBC0_ZASCE|nr:hypothetical protein PRZ48_009291 [Zasmidium cellare]
MPAGATRGGPSAPHGGSPTITVLESASTQRRWRVRTANIISYSAPLSRMATSTQFQGRAIQMMGFQDRTIKDLAELIRGLEFNHHLYDTGNVGSGQREADIKSIVRGYTNLHRLAEIFEVFALMPLADEGFQSWFQNESQTMDFIKLVLDATDSDRYKLSRNMCRLLLQRAAVIMAEPADADVPKFKALEGRHSDFVKDVLKVTLGPREPDPFKYGMSK